MTKATLNIPTIVWPRTEHHTRRMLPVCEIEPGRIIENYEMRARALLCLHRSHGPIQRLHATTSQRMLTHTKARYPWRFWYVISPPMNLRTSDEDPRALNLCHFLISTSAIDELWWSALRQKLDIPLYVTLFDSFLNSSTTLPMNQQLWMN